MKKLFLCLTLVMCMPAPVDAGMTDVVKKGVMGISGTTAVAALAMIIYQSHIIKKLRREKVQLVRSATPGSNSMTSLVSVYQVEKKIHDADTKRAQAIAVLTGSVVVGGAGYLWPEETQTPAPSPNQKPPLPLPAPGPAPVTVVVTSPVIATPTPTLPGPDSTVTVPSPATPVSSLSSGSVAPEPSPVTLPVVGPLKRDELRAELSRIVLVNNGRARFDPSLSYIDLATYSFDSFDTIDYAVQMLAQAFSRMNPLHKTEFKECIFWPMRDRTAVEAGDLVSQQQASFFVKYLLEQHALEGSRMNQVAVMVNSLAHAANVPVPLENLVDVVCVPGDGHCGAHIVAAHELFQSHPDKFSPLVYATYNKVYDVRFNLVRWMYDEITKEMDDVTWNCTIGDCLELSGSYQYLLVKAPWAAELFERFKELFWSNYEDPAYADLVTFFNQLNKNANEVEEGQLSRASDVRESLPRLLEFYDEFVGCSQLDDQYLRDLQSQEPTGLAKGVGDAYYLNDTEWHLLSHQMQIPVIMCKQEIEEGKSNGKYSFIRFFGKEHCKTTQDILSKALFACNVNGNHWVTLVPKKGLVQAAENPKSVSSHV